MIAQVLTNSTVTTTIATFGVSPWESPELQWEFVKSIVLLLISALIAYLLDKRSRKQVAKYEWKEKHFRDIQNRVIKPMIQECRRVRNAVYIILLDDPSQVSFALKNPSDRLYDCMRPHFPEVMRNWNTLVEDCNDFQRRCSSLEAQIWEGIMSEKLFRSTVVVEPKYRLNLYHHIMTYPHRQMEKNSRMGCRVWHSGNKTFPWCVDCTRYDAPRPQQQIFYAMGEREDDMNSLRACIKGTDERYCHDVQDLHRAKDGLVKLADSVKAQLNELLNIREAPNKCDLCN